MTVAPDGEELTVKTGSGTIGGWIGVEVTRGVDQLPSVFSIETTEKEPDDPQIAAIKPGDACQVYLGADLILTGYLNVDGPHIDKENHTIGLAGRSKTQDLVDCSLCPGQPDAAGNMAFASWQITAATLSAAIRPICAPLGIELVLPDDDPVLDPRHPFTIHPGMTCFQLIEEIARTVQMLVWDDPQGRLVLSRIGKKRAGSALVEGVNIEVGEARLSGDQRFSDVYVLGQIAIQGTDGLLHWNPLGHESDPGVLRYRPHVAVVDMLGADPEWPQKYAVWEVHRRFGRSQQRIVSVTGWRDGAGVLWTPNTVVSVASPSLKSSEDRQIAQCTWWRNAMGTGTKILTMPPEGLSVEPFRFTAPVAGAVPATGPAATGSAAPHVGDAI